MEARRIGEALRAACLAELAALKPGNVHRYAPGHGMTPGDFEASAEAVAAVIGLPELSVGERILESVRRTRAAVGCNTNLGIVLLCAPLAQAALQGGGADLRPRLEAVLERLDLSDAALAFQAICLAAPAGLATSPRHDVRAPATVDLREAMAAARDRDRIARQYVTGFRDIFELGLPRLETALARWHSEPWVAACVYLGFLARFPDTHIARKHGLEKAEEVRRRAAPLDLRLHDCADPTAMEEELLEFDAALKAEDVNPGTSADLTVATLFARRLQDEIAAQARQ